MSGICLDRWSCIMFSLCTYQSVRSIAPAPHFDNLHRRDHNTGSAERAAELWSSKSDTVRPACPRLRCLNPTLMAISWSCLFNTQVFNTANPGRSSGRGRLTTLSHLPTNTFLRLPCGSSGYPISGLVCIRGTVHSSTISLKPHKST